LPRRREFSFVRVMPSKHEMAKVRAKVRRRLRRGATPIDIARKLGLPLLLVSEIVIWEASVRQAYGATFDA
jgi:hypothetical protein